MEKSFRITEMFKSIQGEGPHMGMPAYFVRFTGCNLKCPDCDTKYSWTGGKIMTEQQLVNNILSNSKNRLLVLTGGEPLLQPIEKLIRKVWTSVRGIDIETNGTLPPPILFPRENLSYIVSPKLGQLGQLGEVDSTWFHMTNVYWKFVVDKEWLGIIELFVTEHKINRERVYLMPKGISYSKKDWEWLWKVCRDRGYNFSPRLHILLYNGRRGI